MKRFQHQLAQQRQAHLMRTLTPIQSRTQSHIDIQGHEYINFCSSDYLNLAQHPTVVKTLLEAIEALGFGSGSATSIAGYYQGQADFEQAFAEWLGRERALFFNSGYMANLGVITALTQRHDHIYSDKLCHASILDAIQLAKVQHHRYRHCDPTHLETLLDHFSDDTQHWVVTESVFSMEGDIAPIQEIISLLQSKGQNQPGFIVDDAHGIGVLGPCGILEQLPHDGITCLVTPLGKAFASMGAIVSGSSDLIEMLIQFSRPYRYTTALPPAIFKGLLAVLNILQRENWRCQTLKALCDYFVKASQKRGLPLISDAKTPIMSIFIGDDMKTQMLQNTLAQQGFWVSCIRPPTVPQRQSRIRISLNIEHTEAQIMTLLDCFAEALHKKVVQKEGVQ